MRYDLKTQPTLAPTRKIKYAGLSGLVTALIIAAINYYAPGVGDVVGPELAALIVALVSFGAGYLKRERE